MTTEHGIVLRGEVLPGTEWVLRESDAWWSWDRPEDRPDLRHRRALPDVLCGHWTGGNARVGPNTGRAVVRAMKHRVRSDGSVMDVSIHFVIGYDGLVWQTADLAVGCVHAGRAVNARSVGVECCWPGTAEQAVRLGHQAREERRLLGDGRRVLAVPPSDELRESWVRLADALATHLPIPRVTAKGPGIPRAGGAMEHWQAPGTSKADAGCYLLDALRAAGWA